MLRREAPGSTSMPDNIRLTLQVLGSLAIIFGALWWMWRLPGEAVTASAAATVLAFGSAWLGVVSVGFAAGLGLLHDAEWPVAVSVALWAAALATGGLTLWVYRRTPAEQMSEAVLMQRLQARVGIILGLLAVGLWYAFVITHAANLPP